MYFFVIRHIPSGELMRQLPNRGYTIWNWWDDVDILKMAPRLFNTKRGAINALTAFCLGKNEMNYEMEMDEYSMSRYSVPAGISYDKTTMRDKSLFEILQVKLEIN